MAIATAKPRLYLPPTPVACTAAPSFTTTALLIDAASETVAFIIEVPKTGNIRKVMWGTRTVTTGATLDIRLETLDRTTTPAVNSGALWGANTNGAQVVADADDNAAFLTTLTADAAVTQGDAIAVVIKNPEASFGNMQIAGLADDFDVSLPYSLNISAIAVATPIVAFEYSDGTYEPIAGAWPISSTITTTTYSSASTPDTIGFRYQLPYPHRLRGFWLWADIDGDSTVRVVTSAYHQANATGILVSKTVNNEDRDTTGAGVMKYTFPSSIEQAANTNYRVIIEPGATAITLYDLSMNSLAAMDAYLGSAFHLTTAKDPTADGDWTNYNSGTFRMMFGGLILDGFDAGGPPTAADIRTALGLATANLDTQLAAIQADTNDLQARLPAVLVSGRIDASVGAIAANAITAASIADGAIDAATFAAGAINAAAIAADAITDAKVAADVTIASVTGAVGSVATGGITAASFAAGAIDAAAIATDAIGSAELAASAVTKIQVGLSTQAGVDDLPTNAELATALGTADDAVLARLGAPAGASIAADIAAAKVDTAAILDDTGTAGVVVAAASKSGYALTTAPPTAAEVWAAADRTLTAGTGIVLAKGTGVTGFTDISAAQVNAEVLDVMNVDTYAEPGQGAPPATVSIFAGIRYLFKAWRNKSTETATVYSLYNDAENVVDQKSTHSDDGTTFISGEVGSGP